MSDTSTDQRILFEQFIDLYYPPIYSAILKLTGMTDEKELKVITVAIFNDLWTNRQQLLSEMRPPAFVYKILLQHVFSYLQEQGAEERIRSLQNTLLIDPVHYEPVLATGKDSIPRTLLDKIKKLIPF